jgi:hypothetical protein
MKLLFGRLAPATLVFLFLAGAPLRADSSLISWSYDVSASPVSIAADAPGTGSINLSASPSQPVMGSSNIQLLNISTNSSATTTPDTFTAKPYTLSLSLTDTASGQKGTLTFAGHFDGVLTATSAGIKHTFDGDTEKRITLGNTVFDVTVGPFVAPGAPTATLTGSLGAQVSVQSSVNNPPPPTPTPTPSPTPSPESAPEPSTLVLAGLTLPLLSLACRRRRRKVAAE